MADPDDGPPPAKEPAEPTGPKGPRAPRAPRWERLEPDARRAQILRCARDLFAGRRYAAVSMEQIAVAAGVRRGLVNHYFGSKRELFIEVVREMLGSFNAAFPLPARAGPPDEIVADHVRRWLDVVESDAATWFALVGAEGFGRDPDVEKLVDRARDAMVEGIVEVLRPADGAPPGDELRVVLRTYSGLAEVVTREWLQRRTIDRPQAEALLRTALLSLVRDVVPAVRAAGGPGTGPEAEKY
jgi:AcrR family transcriptional regulator